MYFYIYVHMDKAKIATLARLKASSDVINADEAAINTKVLGRNTGRFFIDWQPRKKTTKRTHTSTFTLLRVSEGIGAQLCNLIVSFFIHNAFPQCSMASTNPCSVVWYKYHSTVTTIHFSLCSYFLMNIFRNSFIDFNAHVWKHSNCAKEIYV